MVKCGELWNCEDSVGLEDERLARIRSSPKKRLPGSWAAGEPSREIHDSQFNPLY